MNQSGFFDLEERYEALSQKGDSLEMLANSIPRPGFRPVLNKVLKKERNSREENAQIRRSYVPAEWEVQL